MSTPATILRQRRCDNHPQREASARCPACGRFFCRECVTEHEDRVVCASCLAKQTVGKPRDKTSWDWTPRLALALLAIVVVYLALLLAGNILLSYPSHFHTRGGW